MRKDNCQVFDYIPNYHVSSFNHSADAGPKEDDGFCQLFIEKGRKGYCLAGERLSEARLDQILKNLGTSEASNFVPFNLCFFKMKEEVSLKDLVDFLQKSQLLVNENQKIPTLSLKVLNSLLRSTLFRFQSKKSNDYEKIGKFDLFSITDGSFSRVDPFLQFQVTALADSMNCLCERVLAKLALIKRLSSNLNLSGKISKILPLNVGQAACTYGVFDSNPVSSGFFDLGFERFFAPEKYKTAQQIYRQVRHDGFVVLSHFDTDHFLGAAFSSSQSHNIFLKSWIIPDLSWVKTPNQLVSELSISSILLLVSLFSSGNSSIYMLSSNCNQQWVKVAENVFIQVGLGKNKNDSGIVSYIAGKQGLLVIPGDAKYEDWPVLPRPIKAMVVPHHGSCSLIPSSLLFDPKPSCIIYSGENHYGHPNLCSLLDLKIKGCYPIFRFPNDFFSKQTLNAYCCHNYRVADPVSMISPSDFFVFFE